MIENIAILVGAAALAVSVIACVTFLLLKKNIKDILEKDALIFDKNFEIKKSAIAESFDVVDTINKHGKSIISNSAYLDKAKKCYNNLLCVMNNSQIIEAYYNIALNNNYPISPELISTYKILCRKDIGLKTKSGTLSQPLPNVVTDVQPEQNSSEITQPTITEKPTQTTTNSRIAQARQARMMRSNPDEKK